MREREGRGGGEGGEREGRGRGDGGEREGRGRGEREGKGRGEGGEREGRGRGKGGQRGTQGGCKLLHKVFYKHTYILAPMLSVSFTKAIHNITNLSAVSAVEGSGCGKGCARISMS